MPYMDAFGYVRLSKWDESTTSPQRQRKAIAALCKQRGWKLLEVFEDIDVSAYNGNHRPAFERMMNRLGEVQALVFWTLDRLSRSSVQAGQIAEACKAANVNLVATDMNIDTTSAGGRFVYDVLAAKGQMESATTGERSRAMVAYKRELGEPLGRVPFGWRRVGKRFEADPKAQAALLGAAKRYVRGDSFTAIGRDLGFATGPLSRMLKSQRVQDALPEDLAGALAAAILARKGERVPNSHLSLLGGIARCGECGATMTVTATRAGRKNGRWYSYGCRTAGHVHISARFLDQYITEQVLAAVDSGELLKALKKRKATGRTRKASQLEARLELLEQAHFVEGTVPAARYKNLHAALVEQLAKAQEAEHRDGIDLPAELARDLGATWPKLTVSERRRIIQAVLSKVEVRKAQGHARVVDPGRVTLTWR
jgi:DNA invertase Pin-like site-specific DNA recombinase